MPLLVTLKKPIFLECGVKEIPMFLWVEALIVEEYVQDTRPACSSTKLLAYKTRLEQDFHKMLYPRDDDTIHLTNSNILAAQEIGYDALPNA